MVGFSTFFHMEFKRMGFYIRSLIIGTILIWILVAGMAWVMAVGLGGSTIPKSSVGVVMEDKGAMGERIRRLIEKAPEIKDVFDIRFMTEEEGIRAMDAGEIVSLLKVPPDYIASLISGSNHPIEIRYPLGRIGLPTLLIKQISNATGRYILDTEAGIYSVKDWYEERGEPLSVGKETELNWIYLNTLLGRKSVFHVDTVETMDGIPPTWYYLSSALVLWMMLMGLVCCDMAGKKNHALSDRLALYGLSYIRQAVGRMLAFQAIYLAVAFVGLGIPLVVLVIWFDFPVRMIAALIPVSLLAASFIYLIYTLIRNTAGAMIALLLLTLSMGYVSGLFYPLSFLPSIFQKIAPVLPVRLMFSVFTTACSGEEMGSHVLIACLYAFAFLVAGIVWNSFESRRCRGR